MATYTVDERGRHEKEGRPYTFGGTLGVVHTRDGGARPEHVLVYRRDDGRRVVEFRTGGRRGAGPATATRSWPRRTCGARSSRAAPGRRPAPWPASSGSRSTKAGAAERGGGGRDGALASRRRRDADRGRDRLRRGAVARSAVRPRGRAAGHRGRLLP